MSKPQVVKLAQPGFDVKTAGDENLVYNSNWPLLKIYKTGTFSTSDFNSTQLVASHDLGYVPLFWYYVNNKENYNLDYSTGSWTAAVRAEFMSGGGNLETVINDKGIYLYPSPAGVTIGGTLKLNYTIFALDMTKTYQAPSTKSGGVIGPRNLQTIFKLAKPGKNISSNNLDDYVIHSRARSPLLHSVTSGKAIKDPSYTGGAGFTVNHNLGYNPMFFAFFQIGHGLGFINGPPNAYRPMYSSVGGSPSISSNSQQIRFNSGGVTDTPISVVVLKDPFNVDYSVRVNV